MANYVQYSPWTDAAAYGRGLGDSLSQAMLQMPQQRAALAQQAAMEQTRQREEAQKLAQTEAYQTGMLGVQRSEAEAQNLFRASQLEEMRRKNEEHQAALAAAAQGKFKPVQDKLTGKWYSHNDITGAWKPMDGPPGATPDNSLTPGIVNNFGGMPMTQNQGMKNALDALKMYVGMGSTTATNDPALMAIGSNLMAQATSPYQPRPAVAPLGVPTNAAPVAGLTNAPASGMIPGMTNAAPMKAYNPATGRIE